MNKLMHPEELLLSVWAALTYSAFGLDSEEGASRCTSEHTAVCLEAVPRLQGQNQSRLPEELMSK